jgi:phospholipid/cholesterol/gamma-HCH transport system substrate-binding protein
MKRTGIIKWGNIWIGVLVTFALIVVLYSSFRGGGTSIFESKDKLTAYFYTVNGLVKGAPVWLGGVEVGNVKAISFVNLDERRRIRVDVSLIKTAWPFVTADSRIKLGTIGFLGDKYLEIIPGSKGLPQLKPGDEIAIVDGAGLEALVDKAPQVTNRMDSLLIDLREIGGRISEGRGSAGKFVNDSSLYDNLTAALKQTTEVLADLRKNQDEILKRLNGTLANTQQVTAKIDGGTGSLGLLVNDRAVYDNLNRSSARLDSILARIEHGDGTAGALINDPNLYGDIRELVARVNNLISDIEKNPRKYFKFSVF